MTKREAAKIEKAKWLATCLQNGWDKSELDELSANWDKFKDETGNLRPTPAASTPAPGDKGGEEAAIEILEKHVDPHSYLRVGALEGVIAAMQEYAARWQQSLPTEGRGVRWVKASERKPTKNGVYHVKYTPKEKNVIAPGIAMVVLNSEFGLVKFLNGTTLSESDNNFADENIEWLDESPSAPDTVQGQEELWEEVKKICVSETADWHKIGQLKKIFTLTKK